MTSHALNQGSAHVDHKIGADMLSSGRTKGQGLLARLQHKTRSKCIQTPRQVFGALRSGCQMTSGMNYSGVEEPARHHLEVRLLKAVGIPATH